MLVDVVDPGWAPVCQSNLTEDVPGYLAAPQAALTYSWAHFIGGHMGRLGTRGDVATHRQYMGDIAERSLRALGLSIPARTTSWTARTRQPRCGTIWTPSRPRPPRR